MHWLDELGYDPDDEQVPDVSAIAAVDVPVGAIVRARDARGPVAVARLASGALVVARDECPHDGGRISDGFVDGERLVCARHGWELVVHDGVCIRAANCRNC
jgi:nitrite reductase/ring-hydroxylating ferredoxin subunit